MPHHRKYTTTVVGAHSVPRWYEALDRLVTLGQLSPADFADAQYRVTQAAILEQEIAGIDVITGGERERLAQAAGGIATFLWDLASSECEMTPQIAAFFGFGRDEPTPSFANWQGTILADDFLKLRAAVEDAAQTGSFYAEFRVRGGDGGLRWIAGKGEASADESGGRRYLSGVYRDITERKQLEARLLALNETLEARVAEIREEARTLTTGYSRNAIDHDGVLDHGVNLIMKPFSFDALAAKIASALVMD